MNITTARDIIASLSSLYPLTNIEEEAINTILVPKELIKVLDEWDAIIYGCPNCGNQFASGKFCNQCGQPLIDPDVD